MRRSLLRADSLGTITGEGRELLHLTDYILDVSHNRWGALDSLGMAEQRGIASRMFLNFPMLFNDGYVNAISSYAPRCVMSMYEFTHQIDRLNNHNEIYTMSGRKNSLLLRPFDIDTDYLDWRKEGEWKQVYDKYAAGILDKSSLERILGVDFPLDDNWRDLALDEYHVVAGTAAMGLDVDASVFFTLDEYNRLWSCYNMKHYLQRTATTLSTVPAEITSRLLVDLITTFDEAVKGAVPAKVCLRFGHAETLMPLLSQLHLQGCYYMTNYFDTVAMHWQDFDVVPMAANLQMLLSKTEQGRYYITVYRNERPVKLIQGDDRYVIPYSEARAYMQRCLPLVYQF
ncbi:MAG: hypothetical protein NC082_05950 [Clostridiales bacterium]|nr:hypothetical protein [Clostridiales bacterium]